MVNSNTAKDNQSKELFSVTYTKLDDAIKCILQLGMVVQQVRLDQNNAYHIVPIRPQGQQLWGFRSVGRIYTDLWIEIAPKIFPLEADPISCSLPSIGI